MSSTRYASDQRELAQERYMSSPEFAELRGISGNAAATKASLMFNPRVRSLIYFLQALSLPSLAPINPCDREADMEQGGLKKLANDFLAEFPERISTPAMRKFGIKPGKTYRGEGCETIAWELEKYDWIDEENPSRTVLRGDEIIRVCRAKAEAKLPDFLIQVCINPKVRLWAKSDVQESYLERVGAVAAPEDEIVDAEFPFFENILPALFEFQKRFSKRAEASVVDTSIKKEVWENLDYCLATGKMVVVEGPARVGKTTAARAWVRAHQGEARFVSLYGINNKTQLFRKLAQESGLPSTYTKTATDMQVRFQDLAHRMRGVVWVIDEAHFLWPQGERLYRPPELVDWVDTALVNHGVAVALICTDQFAQRMKRVERQTGWTADQFKGRVGRYKPLPNKPTVADVRAVAKASLPGIHADVIEMVVGYAKAARRPLSIVSDTVSGAAFAASRAGREKFTSEDVEAALEDIVIPSDKQKAQAMENPSTNRRPKNSVAEVLQTVCETRSEKPALAPERSVTPKDFSPDRKHSRAAGALSEIEA